MRGNLVVFYEIREVGWIFGPKKGGLRADQSDYVRGNLVIFYGIREVDWKLKKK
jgi:hypothetical protein